MTRPPSGAQHRIAAGAWSAVATEVGASLRELRHADRTILDGYPAEAMCSGARGVPLIPWPNRIEDARYEFDGETHQLPVDRPSESNAIHGLTRWVSWRTLAHDASRVTLGTFVAPRPGYPFALDVAVTYALSDRGLTCTTTAANVGTRPLPLGVGHHPYLAPRTTLEASRLRVRARRVIEHGGPRGLGGPDLDVEGTPLDLRDGRAIDGLRLHHCYGELERDADGIARVELDDLVLWMDASYRWVLLFSADDLPDPSERRRSLAVEPMTCPANAFRTGRDLIVLRPDESIAMAWGVTRA